jgi:PAS domain S-box-containing protein
MLDLSSRNLALFQDAERVLGRREQLSTKVDNLLCVLRELVEYDYCGIIFNISYAPEVSEIPAELSRHTKDTAATFCTAPLPDMTLEPKVLSLEDISSFFSGIEVSFPVRESVKHCVVVPLFADGFMGLFCVFRESPFSNVDLEQIALFSAQLANALVFQLLSSREGAVESLPFEESKEYYESMIHTTQDMIYTISMEGRFVFANRKVTEIMGNDILGKRFEDVVVPEFHTKVKSEFEKRKRGEASPRYRIQAFSKTGEKVWLEINSNPLFKDGEIVGVCGSARDVTDQMQIEQQRTHLTIIANDILQRKNLKEIMDTVAVAIREYCGFQRVLISLLDEDFEAIHLAFAGLTEEEKTLAFQRHLSPRQRKNIIQEKFRISQSYYIPHDQTPWRERGVQSRLTPEQMKDWHPDDFLFIPLHGEEKKVIGLISVDDPANGRAPTAETLAPVELFATQAAIAIENARLYEQIRHHAEDLESTVVLRTRAREALLETNYKLRGTTSWDKGMKIILEGITEGLGFENAELFLINESKKTLENIAVIGTEKKKDIPLGDLEYVAAQCVDQKRPINIKEASRSVTKQIDPVLESFAWVPIMTQDEVLGVISVYNQTTGRPISDEQLDDLLLFANQAAHFVESTRFLFSPVVENTLTTEMKYRLESGESYLVESAQPTEAFDIFRDAVTHGIQGFSICRMHPKKVRRRFDLKKTPILWLSTIEGEDSVDPKDLAKINHMLNEFLKRASDCILLLEGLEYLIIQNNFEKVVKALHSLNDYVTVSNSRLLVPVNPKTLSEKELSILEKEFMVFKR